MAQSADFERRTSPGERPRLIMPYSDGLLGGYRWEINKVARKGNRASAKARAEQARKRAIDLLPVIEEIKAEIEAANKAVSADGEEKEVSLRQIASALNEQGITTARGGEWSAVQVQRVIQR